MAARVKDGNDVLILVAGRDQVVQGFTLDDVHMWKTFDVHLENHIPCAMDFTAELNSKYIYMYSMHDGAVYIFVIESAALANIVTRLCIHPTEGVVGQVVLDCGFMCVSSSPTQTALGSSDNRAMATVNRSKKYVLVDNVFGFSCHKIGSGSRLATYPANTISG